MNAKQFKYVLVLASECSFSKAADALNITQPSLSQYIKKIEQEVGLELFDRANGDVRVTDAGRIYIETAQKILDLEHQMEVSLSDIAENRAGSVIIGSAPYRTASMMPLIAASFQKIHPGIHLIIREGTTVELVEGIEHGEYDLALTLLPVDKRFFSYERVTEEELILAVPAGYPLLPSVIRADRKWPAVEPDVLKDQALVMLTSGQFMQRQLEDLCINRSISVRPAAIVKSLEAQIEFVKAGVGMALMPGGIERFCKPDEVAFYSFTDALPKREVAVIWRKDRKLPKVTEELKSMICSIPW